MRADADPAGRDALGHALASLRADRLEPGEEVVAGILAAVEGCRERERALSAARSRRVVVTAGIGAATAVTAFGAVVLGARHRRA